MGNLEQVKQVSGVDLSEVYMKEDGAFVVNVSHIAGYSRMIVFTNTLFFVPHILKEKIVRIPLDQLDIELKENSFLKAIFSGKNSIVVQKIKNGSVREEYSTGVGQEVSYQGSVMHANNPKCNVVFVQYINSLVKALKDKIVSPDTMEYSFIKTIFKEDEKLTEKAFSWMGPQEAIFIDNNKVVIINNEGVKQIERSSISNVMLQEWKKALGAEPYVELVLDSGKSICFMDLEGKDKTRELYELIS